MRELSRKEDNCMALQGKKVFSEGRGSTIVSSRGVMKRVILDLGMIYAMVSATRTEDRKFFSGGKGHTIVSSSRVRNRREHTVSYPGTKKIAMASLSRRGHTVGYAR